MRIAIIGTGNVGSAIARGLKGKGHSVTLGARDPGSAEARQLAEASNASVATPQDAATIADIVILALPWAAAEAAVSGLGDLSDKVVVDCMNPLGMVDGAFGLTVGHASSGGEIVQGWLPSARVVKTLNQVGAEIMADNSGLPLRPVMFMAGNDDAAKMDVAALLTDLGFEALDAGDITKARILEPYALVWINQALMRGKGRKWALATVGTTV
jgi:8-hydroxy-5-deazaflavin:NADPH oxidoreductase